MYGDLLKSCPNSVSICLLCLAGIMYHIDLIRDVIDTNLGHLFSTIPLLQDQELLEKLTELIYKKTISCYESDWRTSTYHTLQNT